MKVIDNTIKYYELLMIYDDTSKFTKYKLPEGYHYKFYKMGDEKDWTSIHISSGEFTSYNQGYRLFHEFYDSFMDELHIRCFFIIDDATDEIVATSTVSLLKEKEYGASATVDWLAIKKEYQGKKLSRALISTTISLANELGHTKLLLRTQTTTPLAAKLYLDAGFRPLNTNEKIGWKILKRLTNHEKLNNYKNATDEEMYDKRNIEIQKQLDVIYGKDNYNYSVWYKNGLHNVGVYSNGKAYEYKYYEEKDKIRLEEIKNE